MAEVTVNSSASDNEVLITPDPLSLEDAIADLRNDQAGAISTFLGVTRNNFAGRTVVRLEYEAYIPMALQEMRKICKEVRSRWEVLGLTIRHRIGVVPVGEASVLIVVSSAHRREALEAVAFAIDKVKERVPIWKKEFYSDGSVYEQSTDSSSVWKENKEFLEARELRSLEGQQPTKLQL